MTIEKTINHELELAGWFDKSGMYEGMIGAAVMELVTVFCKQGHSGMSAGLVAGIFKDCVNGLPLMPLTGHDDEWGEDFDGNGTLQNNRCSHVFKRADGSAYDMNAVIFRDEDGCTFTSFDSRRDVTFPYSPKSETVDVKND